MTVIAVSYMLFHKQGDIQGFGFEILPGVLQKMKEQIGSLCEPF